MQVAFQQVDVFGVRPYSGNPLAVITDATALSSEQMQHIARWTNLSETTFLLPPTTPEAHYRVRIFTLARELPFAGHPTLGSAHVWRAIHGQQDSSEIIQECEAGLIPLRAADQGLAFRAPPLLRDGPVDHDDFERLCAVLRLEPDDIVAAAWIDNGPGWVGVMLADADAVLAVEPAATGVPLSNGSIDIGVVGPHAPGHEAQFEVRAFFTDDQHAVREDPVTGSLNASIAQWLTSAGLASAPWTARQGTCLHRDGRIRIEQDGNGAIWVGGAVHTVIDGTITLA